MKRLLLIALVLTLDVNCANRTASLADNNATQNAQPKMESATPASTNRSEVSEESGKETDVPLEFREVDFKNFTYPPSLRKSNITLKDGSYVYEDPDSGGDTFDFKDVDYLDINDDGKKEAIVRVVRVVCGGSCDGGSNLFYIYSVQQNKPRLLWRIETGSLAYGCGLKSFVVNKSTITLETFRKCHLKSVFLASESNPKEIGKFQATGVTRFIFGFNGKTIALKKREFFPSVENDAKNYFPEIIISND